MSSPTPRRDRAWSRPEVPSTPTWPAQLSGIFIFGIAVLFLVAAAWAAWDYLSRGLAIFQQPERQIVADSKPGSASSSDADNGSFHVPRDRQLSKLPSAPAQRPDLFQEAPPPPRPETVAAQARAAAKSRQRTTASEGLESLQAAEVWVQEAQLWRDQVEPLLTNEQGRRVAAQASLVDQFRAVIAQDRPILERATSAQTALQEMLKPVQDATDNPDDYSSVDPAVSSEFQRLRNEAREMGGLMHKLRIQIEAIVRQSEGLAPADVSLADAIAAREQEIAKADAQALEERLTATRRAAAEAKAAAEEAAIQAQGEREAAAIRARAERDRLVARVKQPDVQRYLAPFIAKGYFQPRGQLLSVYYERTTKQQPVSYSLLQGTRALDDSVQGLQTLNLLASAGYSSNNPWHDRPTWNFALDRPWSKSDQEYIAHAQSLLRELGSTLVELEMLAP